MENATTTSTLRHEAIAIDGPAASGKSTVARRLAEQLGLIMVNSGAMYRAVTWEVVRQGVDPREAEAIVSLLGRMDLECGVRDGHSIITVGGVDPGEALRSDEVHAAVSAVAAVPEVREVLVAKQRELLRLGDLVMEGRDIGSVVFPETPYKFYIDASEEVRAQRRAAEGQTDEVGERDRQDARRKTSPLVIPDGAQVIDSSEIRVDEVLEQTMDGLRARGWFARETEDMGG